MVWMNQPWRVTVQSQNLDFPVVVDAIGSDRDDALTDAENRGNYFPNSGDRILRIVEKHPPFDRPQRQTSRKQGRGPMDGPPGVLS